MLIRNILLNFCELLCWHPAPRSRGPDLQLI